MKTIPEDKTEAAVYWSAVSLIVCEGLSIDKAAERLDVETSRLRDILHRRQMLRTMNPSAYPPTRPIGLLQQ
jgi:transposase